MARQLHPAKPALCYMLRTLNTLYFALQGHRASFSRVAGMPGRGMERYVNGNFYTPKSSYVIPYAESVRFAKHTFRRFGFACRLFSLWEKTGDSPLALLERTRSGSSLRLGYTDGHVIIFFLFQPIKTLAYFSVGSTRSPTALHHVAIDAFRQESVTGW